MEKEYIELIQKKVVGLLKSYSNKPLFILAEDNCSELSRLVGSWILRDFPNAQVFIMKGEEINDNKNLSHDVLIIENQNKFYILDPAIWQFSKNSKNILIKITYSMENVHQDLERKYGGHWTISEKLESASEKQANEWKKIIQKNIEESDLKI